MNPQESINEIRQVKKEMKKMKKKKKCLSAENVVDSPDLIWIYLASSTRSMILNALNRTNLNVSLPTSRTLQLNDRQKYTFASE